VRAAPPANYYLSRAHVEFAAAAAAVAVIMPLSRQQENKRCLLSPCSMFS